MSNFKTVLRDLRNKRNLTQEALANKLNTSKSTISMYENGNREPDFETLETIADFFNVNMDFLLGRSKYNTQLVKHSPSTSTSRGISIPVLNTVVAGMPIEAYEDILGYEEISRELASTGEFFALQIKGDSMLPVLQEKDVVIIRQQSDVESGDIAIVLIGGETATVKKVMKQESGITLIGFNPAVYEPHFYSNEDIESLPIKIAGKVVEMKRSF